MASFSSPLAHRALTSRVAGSPGAVGASGGDGSGHGPSTPGGQVTGQHHTPLRTTPSVFGSPSAVRAEEETIVIELGARRVRIGLAGDVVCRASLTFGPEQQRRVGDLRLWQDGYKRDWRRAGADGTGKSWDTAFELYQLDVRHTDAGLVADKLDRALREAFTKYLLLDSKPRRMIVVLPPAMPIPLLSTTLDTLFGRYQSPSISLLSSPVAAAVAAGLRSALVVDLGWAETVVTSIYEYREVACTRSVRAGRLLVQNVHDLLAEALGEGSGGEAAQTETSTAAPARPHVLSFEECEDVTARMVWCRPAAVRPTSSRDKSTPTDGLSTVPETDENEEETEQAAEDARTSIRSTSSKTTEIPLQSCTAPTTVRLTFDQLAQPSESTFFGGEDSGVGSENAYDNPTRWDDQELPVPLLVFRHLQRLPVDARAVCMARILFVGGCTKVLGLRGRIFDDVARLVAEQGWDGVRGKAVGQFQTNPKLDRRKQKSGGGQQTDSTKGHAPAQQPNAPDSPDVVWHDAASAVPEDDPVEAEIARARARNDAALRKGPPVVVNGRLGALETLGAWSGASMLAQLRVPAIATVDKDQWTQQGGAAGAGRTGDLDVKALHQHSRQSMGPGGLVRAAGGGAGGSGAGGGNWTLGAWGVL